MRQIFISYNILSIFDFAGLDSDKAQLYNDGLFRYITLLSFISFSLVISTFNCKKNEIIQYIFSANPAFLMKLTCLLRDRYVNHTNEDMDHYDKPADTIEEEPVYADIASLRGRRMSNMSSRVTSLFCCRVARASRMMEY